MMFGAFFGLFTGFRAERGGFRPEIRLGSRFFSAGRKMAFLKFDHSFVQTLICYPSRRLLAPPLWELRPNPVPSFLPPWS